MARATRTLLWASLALVLALPAGAAQECPAPPLVEAAQGPYELPPLRVGETSTFEYGVLVRCEGRNPNELRQYEARFSFRPGDRFPDTILVTPTPAAAPLPDGPCPAGGWWNVTTTFEAFVAAPTRMGVYPGVAEGHLVCGAHRAESERLATAWAAYEPAFEAAPEEDVVRVTSVGQFTGILAAFNRGNAPVLVNWSVDDPLDDPESARYWAPWIEEAGELRARGVELRRLRVVNDPPSEYGRYAYAGADWNCHAGEDVRWLPRRMAPGLLLHLPAEAVVRLGELPERLRHLGNRLVRIEAKDDHRALCWGESHERS